LCGKQAKSGVFSAKNTREEVKHATYMDNPRDGHDQKILLVRKNHKKTINIRKNARAIPSQRARLNFASSVAMMNFEVKSILLFAQDLRQGRDTGMLMLII